MTSRPIQEIIDLYIVDGLSADEKALFESRMTQDSALREQVELTRHIVKALGQHAESDAYEAMKELDEEAVERITGNIEKTHRKRPLSKHRILYMAASCAAAVLVLLFVGWQPKYTAGELYKEYYSTPRYEVLPPSRGGAFISEQQKRQLTQAASLYETGNYDGAATIFGQIDGQLQPEGLPDDMLFYWAVCLAQTGREKDAIRKFETLTGSENSGFREDAQWLAMLVYLKTEQRTEAKDALSEIIDRNGVYEAQARELLNKLKENRWF